MGCTKWIALFLATATLQACGQTTATTEEPATYEEADQGRLTDLWEEAGAQIASERGFVRRDLGGGVFAEFPDHWYVLNSDQSANVSAAGTALAESAGVRVQGKRTLLAVNATPAPTGAMIRVSATSPAEISQDELEQVLRSGTQRELLQEIRRQFSAAFPQMMAQSNITVTEISEPQIVHVAGRPAILISYQRTSAVDGSPWEVRQYKIPAGDRTVELTLSNRISDRAMWTPILNRTLESLSVR